MQIHGTCNSKILDENVINETNMFYNKTGFAHIRHVRVLFFKGTVCVWSFRNMWHEHVYSCCVCPAPENPYWNHFVCFIYCNVDIKIVKYFRYTIYIM